MAIYNHPLLCTISILLQEPINNPSNLRFYSMRISEQELYHTLSQPATMKILKQAVYAEYYSQKKNKTYASYFYEKDELILETQLEVMKNILHRKGLPIYEEHTNLSGWLFRTFKNACFDVLRRKNNQGSRERVSFESPENSHTFVINTATSPVESCFTQHYGKQLDATIHSLSPIVVLRSQTVITPIRSLAYLLLHSPDEVTFEDFSSASNYTRTLENIWNTWNHYREIYYDLQEGDTPVKIRSRKFLVWLLKGEDYSDASEFEKSSPVLFKKTRDTLRKTVNRAREDLMCITIVRASLNTQINEELFKIIVRKSVPMLISYSGMIDSMVHAICLYRADHDMLARLLFSTHSTLIERKNDTRTSAQSRFQYVLQQEG